MQNNEDFSQEHLAAWFVPCRVGTDRTMHISFKSGTVLRFDVSEWPAPYDDQKTAQTQFQLRRAADILKAAPDEFATVPSIAKAYKNLEKVWNDTELGKTDPQVELLIKHARQLRTELADLCARPRAVLKTEHRMQKLMKVRRIDAKTLQWLVAQPGRNTAERAGSRQQIKAPKRYESINTLENQVLRAFAALTVRVTQAALNSTNESKPNKQVELGAVDRPEPEYLLKKIGEFAPYKAILEAHQSRARRIENMLCERNVPEANPHVRPNFPIRYDPRYNKIWHAWQALRRESSATELDWMWQHRTFMEILGLRAAMLFHKKTYNSPDDGNIAHFPVLKASQSSPIQGCHLNSSGIRATYRICRQQSEKDNIYKFQTVNSNDDLPLGAITAINPLVNSSRKKAELWWNMPEFSGNNIYPYSVGVGALPWDHKNSWDNSIDKWIDSALS